MVGHLKELAGIKTGCVYKHVRGLNYFIAAVWKKFIFFLNQIIEYVHVFSASYFILQCKLRISARRLYFKLFGPPLQLPRFMHTYYLLIWT